MERSINALLNSNLRVIIPDFGAFIIRQKEPRIVVFNEFLRYNDGLLTGYVSKTEGIDLDMANQLVSEFASNITKVLDSGKTYSLEGIGILQKDSSGKIIFESEHKMVKPDVIREIEAESPIILSEERSSGQVSSEEAPVTPSPEPAQEPEKQPKPKPEPKPKTKPAVRPKTKPTSKPGSKPGPLPRQKKKVVEPFEIQIPETVSEVKEEKLPEIPPKASKDIIIPPAAVVHEEKPIPVHENPASLAPPVEDRMNGSDQAPDQVKLIIRWIVIILLANGAIIAWFIFGDHIRTLFRKEKPEVGFMDSVYQQLSDSVRAAALDTSLIFKESSEITAINSDTAARENLRYYIVAGCFRDEINADELVKSLKDQGFDAEKFGTIGNLFAVSFASFDDKEMAVKELKRIREEIHPEAWMTRF